MKLIHSQRKMFNRRNETLNRIARSIIGLLIYSFGEYLSIVANVGLSPWASFTMGIANIVHISYGKVQIAVSVAVLIADILMREKIGVGTVLDTFLVGLFIDTITYVLHLSYLNSAYAGIILLILSTFVMVAGQYMHMSSGLSCGPRDSLMLGIGKRLPYFDIGFVDIIIKTVLFIISLIIGGPIGIGTLISVVFFGLVMRIEYKLFKFEPREVNHESLLETLNIVFNRY